jgi:NADPH:quinone reductase-like Zn-dependent oxidoreductase
LKAAVINRYGGNDEVEIRDVPKPVCGPEDVLIKVHAAAINPVDWKVRSGQARIITGCRFPKILGNECSGEVVEVGERVHTFRQGDQVIGWPGVRRLGAFAEYVTTREGTTFAKSRRITFEQAACLPIAGLTALQALRDKGQIAYGKKVLINGAAGGVGHFAVQIAGIFGADVTGVCGTFNRETVRALGAHAVIDYTAEDFTRSANRYDIIFDAVAKRSFRDCKRVLARHGVYVSTLPSAGVLLNQYLTGYLGGKKAAAMWVMPNQADLEWISKHVETGKIEILIDLTYPLEQTQEALAYSETGRARGKMVLHIASE